MSLRSGQNRFPFATVHRDITIAKQELEFPRGTANLHLFHNEKWIISKDSYNKRYEKYDCCKIDKGGNPTSINCAFKQITELIPNGGNKLGFR